MYRVEYLPLAEQDLLEAVDYIAHTLEAPDAARELLAAVDEAVERLAAYPYGFELYRTDRPMGDEVRRVPVKGYVLFYAVFPDRVEIWRFLHERRDRTKQKLDTE